ncbi:hypothetical protein OH491_13330 [Termitidicoccus mucosus]|uniref:Uncharacterized protein n=1 Tax=Termitidicoccus mucosus TaxID=1184151 RepID=A0A178IHM0_9BACT|nr:hypothetical protein AW736_14120 [Opitutaceae bacterium TSB47]
MKIELNPKELFSFEKVISPATIKLVFFAAVAVKLVDAIVDLIRYRFTGYAVMDFLTGVILWAVSTFLAAQLLLALQQKFAPEPPAAPPPPAPQA